LIQFSFYENCSSGKIRRVGSMLLDDRMYAIIKTIGLIKACENKRQDIVQLLCNKKIFLHGIDEAGNNLLHVAAASSGEIFDIVLQQYEFPEKTLLQCNNENNTVFYVGCAYNIFKDTNDYLFKRCSDVKNFLHREL